MGDIKLSEKIRITKRHPLSKKEVKELKEVIIREFPKIPMQWEKVEIASYENIDIYLDNGIPCVVKANGLMFPTLLCLIKRGYQWINGVIIDRGATNAVSRGADLMLPGIKSVKGEFNENSIIASFDQEKEVPVMVGKTLYSSKKIEELIGQKSKGKAIENLHYAGDLIWKISVTL
jgi:PUA domain protein